MAEWWRSWHGAPTDPKWRLIAKRAKVSTSAVVAVAWALFDRASQAEQRGSIEGFDPEVIADFLDMDPDDVERIIEAMRSKSILDGNQVSSWEKRQKAFAWWLDDEWTATRHAVFARDGRVCRYCGVMSGPFEIDHVFPRSRGGADTLENLTVACAACNRSKGARTPEEWRPMQ